MKKQIFRNISANLLNLVISIFIGLLLTPILVKKLGIEVYGILPIALFLTFYMGVIAQSLTASVNRFLIEKFISNKIEDANIIFSTSFILITIYVLVLGIILIYPILHIGDFLIIPFGHNNEAVKLFLSVLLSFMFAMISSSLSVSMYAKNRIDLMQFGNIIRNLTKVLCVLLFLELGFISLSYVGLAIIVSEVVYLFFAIIVWRVLTPELSLKLSFFRKSKVKELTLFSGWVLFDQIGTILFLKTDLILVNSLMGSKANGEYSIATQFSDLLRSLAGLVASSLGPMMIILYEEKKYSKLTSMTIAFVKLLSLSLATPIILLCLFSREILRIWMGEQFVHLAPLVCLVTLPLIINLGTLPILSINLAIKKIQIPALVNCILAVVGIVTSLIIYNVTDIGYYAIAIAYVLTLTVKNAIFIPWYAAIILEIPKITFFKTHLNSIIFSIMFFILSYYSKNILSHHGVNVFVGIIVLGILGFIFSFFFYNRKEKIVFYNLFNRKMS